MRAVAWTRRWITSMPSAATPIRASGAVPIKTASISSGCTPAEATWKAGVDVLSFGATKNGALTAEAVVFFDRELAANMAERRKRAGHLVSKHRYVALQFAAFLKDDCWLRLSAAALRRTRRRGGEGARS